jgi:hypothetical protein
MTTLKITIDDQSNAKVLASFLRTLGYVKSVSVEKKLKPLTDDDWILPGRPATDEEIDKLLDEMEKDDDEGYTSEQMLAHLEEWKKKSA